MQDVSSVTYSQVEPDDPILNMVAKHIEPEEINSSNIQNVIDYMLMLSAGKGHDEKDTRQMVGLAAPQIGQSFRIITVDITADGSNKPQQLEVFINPVITRSSTATVLGREGCWSCDNVCGIVERAKSVTLKALNRYGVPLQYKFDGFVARIVQHEVDHLNGVRFPDRVPIGKPEYLHWVEINEFGKYRTQWATWDKLCPRERWQDIKNGTNIA